MTIRTRRIAPLALTAALALGVTACAAEGDDVDVTTEEGTDDGMTDDGMTDDGMTDETTEETEAEG